MLRQPDALLMRSSRHTGANSMTVMHIFIGLAHKGLKKWGNNPKEKKRGTFSIGGAGPQLRGLPEIHTSSFAGNGNGQTLVTNAIAMCDLRLDSP